MRAHLATYGTFLNGSEVSYGDDIPNTNQPSITSFFQKQAETNAKMLLEQSLARWIVADDMAFNTIESSRYFETYVLRCRSTPARQWLVESMQNSTRVAHI
ncbi:hypothetical protein V1525DRAFT_414884 [Lipomyces kononenkoae]|uniref:Uncharacterized protein n=1 Tax=Lipomyces kononenkoae TaxID=34357 RepID=A0ACC3SS09_LIPKO